MGEYGMVQMYCSDIHCDCRRVLIGFYRDNIRHGLIGYGWEDFAFYKKRMGSGNLRSQIIEFMGPALHDMIMDKPYSDKFVKLTIEILKDEKYVKRLIANYKLFKNIIEQKN